MVKSRFDFSKPASAYFHIPFCRHRCGYCNFALVAKRDYLIDRFLDALEIELKLDSDHIKLETLFLGGGTPTHLDSKQLSRLFQLIRRKFDFEDAEVTTEANPSDLDERKIATLMKLGVNRFSLGVQSFREAKLKLLERDHRAAQVKEVVRNLQKHTLNISFDLIFATEGESLEQWRQDLLAAIELGPAHLSTYELTIEKGTQFWKRESTGQLSKPDEELRADMYGLSQALLAEHGFEQYEVSSFAAQGFRCRHNLVYWSGQPYLAFGAGASGYQNGIRTTNHASVSTYIKRLVAGESPISFSEALPEEARARELLVVGLRKMDGIQAHEFQQIAGMELRSLLQGAKVEGLFELGLLESFSDGIRMTQSGIMLYDSIAETLLEN